MTSDGARSDKTAATAPEFDLRPGREEDFEFARALYLESMIPLLSALNAWDEEKIETAFRGYYDVDEIRIVTLKGKDVGWIQVSQTEEEYCIDQLHLLEEARNQGIGSTLIQGIIDKATEGRKNVSLSLVKGNRAIRLYKRLGFERVGEDHTKIHRRLVTSPVG